MKLFPYHSILDQSLIRFDMANEMLLLCKEMPEVRLRGKNFRQLKKSLKGFGWKYERHFPYKGKCRCTTSLLDIVNNNIIC